MDTRSLPTFHLLGPITVIDPAGQPLSVGSPRRRAMLAALLVHAGTSLTVERLVDMLWPDPPPPTAATMVHGTVSAIRRALDAVAPHIIVTRDGGYLLDAPPERVDAARFERALDVGRRLLATAPRQASSLLAEALAEWRGPALAGVEEPFARAAAARWDELRVQCYELHADAELRLNRHDAVVARLEELAAAHPLREELCAQLIVALYRCGRQTDALAAYRRLRAALVGELGVEPGERLRGLELAVLRHDPRLQPTRGGGRVLPAPLGTFVGRDGALDELSALVRSNRLVTLTGPGGAGKTRLALEVGRRLSDVDVHLVELAPLSTAALVAETLADSLGVRAEPGHALARTIAAALSSRPAVVVLDNCEHLVSACAELVQILLAGAADLRVLATSREPLGVPGECVNPVRPLRAPAADESWECSAESDAVRLFADRVAAARPGFVVTAGNAALVGEVCRRLDGLPLALELAAARAASMPLRDLADRLDDRFRLLDSTTRTVNPRHRGLAATVAWSHDLLTAPERMLFARVAVFPATFTLDAAEAVAHGPDLPARDVALLLARLVACSTVQIDDEPDGTARYRMLETTRRFALDRLPDTERGVLGARHARHYLAQTEAAERHLFRAGSGQWLARLHREQSNLRSALDWSFGPEGDPELGARLGGCLWHYWDLRGARDEGLYWVHRGLGAVGPDRPAERLPLLSAGALLHVGRAEFEATENLAREQLTLARAVGAPAWEGDALAMTGTVAWARGRFDRAQQLYEDGIAASVTAGDLWRAAMAEAQLARLHRDRNEPDVARTVALRSLAHADEVGEALARGLSRDVLASLEQRWGDAVAARRLVEEALTHYRLVEYREGEASAQHLAGRIALASHELDAARAAFRRSLRLCRRIGHRAGTVAALEDLAAVATAAADDDAATRLTATASALRTEIGIARPASPHG